jgi:hypothetical protein
VLDTHSVKQCARLSDKCAIGVRTTHERSRSSPRPPSQPSVSDGGRTVRVASRAIVMQQKTHRPVQFEVTIDDAREPRSVDWPSRVALGGLPVSEPATRIAPHRHAPVRAHPPRLGLGHRTRDDRVRNALDATQQGVDDLQEDEEPASGADPLGAHEVWRARCAILESRSMTRSTSPSRLTSE